MALIDRIRFLCNKKGISIKQLEEILNYGNGSLAKSGSIKSDRIVEIADYFGISTDELLGRPDYVVRDSLGNDVLIEYVSSMSKSNRDALLKYAKFLAEECNNVG